MRISQSLACKNRNLLLAGSEISTVRANGTASQRDRIAPLRSTGLYDRCAMHPHASTSSRSARIEHSRISLLVPLERVSGLRPIIVLPTRRTFRPLFLCFVNGVVKARDGGFA